MEPRPDRRRESRCSAARWRSAGPGPFQVQAAIAAVHAEAPRPEDTDWAQIVALYDRLAAMAPSPVVELNRAVAVAMADRPASAGSC